MTTVSVWSDLPLNRWLVLAAVLIVMLNINRLIELLPYLVRAIIDWKANMRLEASVPRTRSRDIISISMIFPFCLLADRYGLVTIDALSFCPGHLSALATGGVFIAYLLLRHIVYIIWMPEKSDASTYRTARSCERNYFIMIVAAELFTAGALSITGIPDEAVRRVLLYGLAALYLLTLTRKSQILSSSYNPFSTFLYLCALELVPTAMLALASLKL